MVALLFCRVRLEGKKPRDKAYPNEVKTIGDAIRKRRLDLALGQRDVAEIFGCTQSSVVNWEKGHTTPRINHLARIIKFLGYNPFSKGTTVAERIVNHRRALGVSQEEFAHQIGVDHQRFHGGNATSGSRRENLPTFWTLFSMKGSVPRIYFEQLRPYGLVRWDMPTIFVGIMTCQIQQRTCESF